MKEPQFNPFDRSTRREAVTSIVREAILSALSEHKEGLAGNAIVASVGHRKAAVFSTLKSMWEAGDVSARPRTGRGGGVLWTAP